MKLNLIVFRRFSSSKDFPPLIIRGLTDRYEEKTKHERKKPIHDMYPEKIDWTSIWPAAGTFSQSIIPLSIRQGYCKNHVENKGISPDKYGNAELMKIPNFFHLTTSHIKKHCDSLKKFCTEWPVGLNSNENIKKHYPIELVSRNYLFSSHSIRDSRASKVTFKVCLSALNLSDKAKRKLLRLAIGPGPGRKVASYDWKTDILQLDTMRCPTSKQNKDYLLYVFTVLALESRKIQTWEVSGSDDCDWNAFDWNQSQSKQQLIDQLKENASKKEDLVEKSAVINHYRVALENIWSENDILKRDQWVQRPDPPRFRHCRFKPIKNIPFETIPGADNMQFLDDYAEATRKIVGLSTKK